MDYLKYIMPPIIGAIIGYVTNWIAIKMMFRPLKPIKIGKFRLPFTPGIIPKNRERIAKSIAVAINDNLLTNSDITDKLMSDDIQDSIRAKVSNFAMSDELLGDKLLNTIDRSKFNSIRGNLTNKISNSIYLSILEANVGQIVGEQVELAASEKLKGSLLGVFGGNSIVSSVKTMAEAKTNEYIEQNGQRVITELINKKTDDLLDTPICVLTDNLDIDLPEAVLSVYKKFVQEKFEEIIKSINITQIIEDKINSMDVLEIEKLILSVMKKELNALVSLGAVIGFVLGLFNIFF
ncbi:MAG: DUF445 family protein [Clostridia bacterium]|nr:DUF445 family protein [Clostridia bacterium]